MLLPGGDSDGKPILSVLAKATYSIRQGTIAPADEQLPLCSEDIYVDPGNPLYSEVDDETDLIAYKPTTDVVIKGSAQCPQNKKAYHLDLEAIIGPYKKTVRVFGNRQVKQRAFRGYSIGDPEPFEKIELGYRNAYGGIASSKNGTIYSYYPNPIGKGFYLKGGFDEDSVVFALPNLEDPDSPLTEEQLILSSIEDWKSAPRPASFGWTRRNFFPRYIYAGVLPEYLDAAKESMKQQKANNPGAAPAADIPRMDFRVYQGASDGLWGEKLKGNEKVKLTYFDREYPNFECALPDEYPTLTIDKGDGPQELERNLQTVMIDMDKKIMTLVWRGSLVYGGIEELATLKKLEAKVI